MNSDKHEERKESPGYSEITEQVSVVLVTPLYAGNVGSVARCMHNFGFSDLRLVSPRCTLDGDARKMAMYSHDILDNASFFDSLEDATKDIDINAGTTRRMGKGRGRYFTPRDMAVQVSGFKKDTRLALIFGPEDAGLANEHIDLCDWLVTIKTPSEFDSLNLSHAVAVTLYEICATILSPCDETENEAPQESEGLIRHLEAVLRNSDFIPEGRDNKRVLLTLRRMISGAGWSRSEKELMHGIISHLEKQS